MIDIFAWIVLLILLASAQLCIQWVGALSDVSSAKAASSAVNLITEDARASIRRLFPLMILPFVILPFVAMLGGALSTSNIDGGVEHDHRP
jgi:hypothetical protein